MNRKEEALTLMEEFKHCRPQIFFKKISDVERGTHFVLGYLANHTDDIISSNISNALNVSTARMAKLLNNMEKKGLITKSTSPTDARKTIVNLTSKGKSIANRHKELLVEITMKMIDEVGYEELKEFVRISYKMKNAMLANKSIIEQLKEIENN